MLHIKLKESKIQQYGSKYFAHIPLRLLGWGSKLKKISEDGLVAYQIKGNHEYSNTVIPVDPQPSPLDPGVRSKGHNSKFSGHGHVA